MSDPRKFNYANSDVNSDNSRFFTEFPRIQVKPQRSYEESDFRTLPTPERHELLSRLIDHVKEL
jgi:hypothetical protein